MQNQQNQLIPKTPSDGPVHSAAPATESHPPKRRRRWFQFSLRTLMIVVTLLAVACGTIMWSLRYRQQLIRARDERKAEQKAARLGNLLNYPRLEAQSLSAVDQAHLKAIYGSR